MKMVRIFLNINMSGNKKSYVNIKIISGKPILGDVS
jgi:hypothetical protein